MINLSSMPLRDEQEKLLTHGPKFVITPREAPVKEYIVAVEQALQNLNKESKKSLD